MCSLFPSLFFPIFSIFSVWPCAFSLSISGQPRLGRQKAFRFETVDFPPPRSWRHVSVQYLIAMKEEMKEETMESSWFESISDYEVRGSPARLKEIGL